MRRSERIVRLTRQLLDHPGKPLSLTELAEEYEVAKSSLSEDLAIIRAVIETEDEGQLHTQTGALGGVVYQPGISRKRSQHFIDTALTQLSHADRILPGGFLYMSDFLSEPEVLRTVGVLFARHFASEAPDVVLTVETKGIPLAVVTARVLNRPFLIARRDHRVTEGSSVSVNYVSGSDRRIQTMSLSRRSLKERARVLVVDDFMKAGGTAKALISLMDEFNAKVVGVGIFMETAEPEDKLVSNYVSLLALARVDEASRRVVIEPGNYFSENRGKIHG